MLHTGLPLATEPVAGTDLALISMSYLLWRRRKVAKLGTQVLNVWLLFLMLFCTIEQYDAQLTLTNAWPKLSQAIFLICLFAIMLQHALQVKPITVKPGYFTQVFEPPLSRILPHVRQTRQVVWLKHQHSSQAPRP